MKFFAMFALAATTSAVQLETMTQEQIVAEVQTGMEIAEFIQTLNRIEDRMGQREQEKAAGKTTAHTIESLNQKIKQLEQNQFDVNGAIRLGQGLWNKYHG